MTSFLERILSLKEGSLAGADRIAPHFAAQYGSWVILGLFVALLALTILTVVSYLREGDNPRRAKLILAGIRMLVIIIIFALLWQPILTVSRKQTLYSTVVVLVDDSASMSLADRYANADSRTALAAKLSVGPEELKDISRAEIVRRLMAREGGPLAELAKDHPLVIHRFPNIQGSEKYTAEVVSIDDTGSAEKKAANQTAQQIGKSLSDLKYDGAETNISAALRSVVNEIQGRRLAGIVLVSDGQITGGNDARGRLNAALAFIRQHGHKVYTVGVGDPEPPRNVAIASLQSPGEVRQGSDVEMTAYIANRRCVGQAVDLELRRRPSGNNEDWEKVDMTSPASVTLTGKGDDKGDTQEVPIRFVIPKDASGKTLGEYVYELTVKPLENEFSTKDNVATATLRVSSEKIKVLLVSGDAGWEFQYLRNLLLRSPDHYAVSVWQEDAEQEFNQEASSKDMQLSTLPRTKEEVNKYEVVVLYDPYKTENGFDKTFVRLLEDFVAVHHGGLLYIASNKYSDENLADVREAYSDLVDLLPVVLDPQTANASRWINAEEPQAWQVLPTASGLEHQAMRLTASPKENNDIWRLLPGVYWGHAVKRIKPLATALAVTADPSMRSGDNGGPLPLIAVQYYGRGRSMYVGFDETWRWRYINDGNVYRKFWYNMIDFLSAGNLEKKRILITTGTDTAAVGEEIRIHVEAYNKKWEPLTEDKITVRLEDPTGAKQPIPITLGKVTRKIKDADGKESTRAIDGHYEGTWKLTTEGRFQLITGDESEKDDVAPKMLTVTLPQDEFKHPESDMATLQTIAPGESFMTVDQADKLTTLIAPDKMVVYNDHSFELWDAPLSIIVVVSLLAIEWILRKKYNMA